MAFRDYVEFAAPLRLPIGGKTYEIPPIPAGLGVQLLGVLEGDESSLQERRPRQLWALLLGSAGEEMLADGVPWGAYDRAGLTVMADYSAGREAAERVWETGLDPEALAAMTAALRETQDSTPSPSTGEATTTRRRASTSGTTSRQTTRRNAAKAGKLPGGR